MNDELNIRGVVTPVKSVKAQIQPYARVQGVAQKTSGNGGAGVIMKTKEEWAELPQLKSIKGCFYVYTNYREEVDPDTGEVTLIPRIKIGDGVTYVVDLPFSTMSITDEDIARWNDHVGVVVDENTNTLIFYH